MKTLVVYYSRKGSNEYLARKIANRLNCEIEAIRPHVDTFGMILMNMSTGIRPLKHPVEEYDRVILVGPIFVGRFIPPLRSFLTRYRKKIKQLVFVTCCGSTYKDKDNKFGHGLVFEKVRGIMEGTPVHTQAFPIGLVLPEEQKEDTEAFMKTHLTDANFEGEIAERFEAFMTGLEEATRERKAV